MNEWVFEMFMTLQRYSELLAIGTLCGFSFGLTAAADFQMDIGRGSLALITISLLTLVAAQMSRPLWLKLPISGVLSALLRSGSVAFAAVLVILVFEPGAFSNLRLLSWLAAQLFLMAVILDQLTGILSKSLGLPEASIVVMAGLIFLVLAPVWAGPLILASGHSADFLVYLSPATYLAVQIDADLYRTQLFYQFSPVGGMRYTYPSPEAVLLASFLVALLLQITLNFRKNTPKGNLL